MNKEKTFLYYRNTTNNINFFVKLILFITISTISMFEGSIAVKASIIICTVLLIKIWIKCKCQSVFKFLTISSLSIGLFWMVFGKEKTALLHTDSDLINSIFSYQIINAVLKLWCVFLIGYLLLSSISQKEIIENLLLIGTNVHVIIFIIISVNALVYFWDSISFITMAYKSRNSSDNRIKKYYYILCAMLVDGLFLITEIRKTYYFYEKQIKLVLRGEYVKS